MIFSQLQKSWHLPLIRKVHKIVDIGLALLVLLLGLSFSMTMRIMFVNLWATVELVSSRMVIPRATAFERNCLHTEWLRAVIWAHSQNILFYLVRQMSPTQKGSGYLTEEGVSFFYRISPSQLLLVWLFNWGSVTMNSVDSKIWGKSSDLRSFPLPVPGRPVACFELKILVQTKSPEQQNNDYYYVPFVCVCVQ